MEVKSVRLTPDVIKGVLYRAEIEDVDEKTIVNRGTTRSHKRAYHTVYLTVLVYNGGF